jgi:hypothetical protein
MIKEVIKVCHRGQRQDMYAKDADKHDLLAVKSMLLHAAVTPQILVDEERLKVLYISSALYSSVCLSVCLSVRALLFLFLFSVFRPAFFTDHAVNIIEYFSRTKPR